MSEARYFPALERSTALLAVLVIPLAWLTTSRPISLGVTLGAGLMVLNAWALGRLGRRLFRMPARPGLAVGLFGLKFLALIALVALAVRALPLEPVGLLVGVSVFPMAVLLTALRSGGSAAAGTRTGAEGEAGKDAGIGARAPEEEA